MLACLSLANLAAQQPLPASSIGGSVPPGHPAAAAVSYAYAPHRVYDTRRGAFVDFDIQIVPEALLLDLVNGAFQAAFWQAADLTAAERLSGHYGGALARLAQAGFARLASLRQPARKSLLLKRGLRHGLARSVWSASVMVLVH